MKKIWTVSAAVCILFAAGCGGGGGKDKDADTSTADGVDTADQVIDTSPDQAQDTLPPDVEDEDILEEPADECYDNSECGDTEYCRFQRGECEGPGVCEDRGDGDCPAVYHPVCGCDGVTYGNTCEAAFAGASILANGPCGEEPCFQGDPTGACAETEFCEGPAGACDDEVEGWCMPVPEGCDMVEDPVCGCDGETYGNDCFRQMAGVWLDYEGACGTIEGCYDHRECDREDFCEFMAGACEGPGECIYRGNGICPDIYSPVCGCDENTYGNDCERRYAGVSLYYVGECLSTTECFDNTGCAHDQFCEFLAGRCEGPGECISRGSGMCPDVYFPVCGCDDVTYDNDCLRKLAGISLQHVGECVTTP